MVLIAEWTQPVELDAVDNPNLTVDKVNNQIFQNLLFLNRNRDVSVQEVNAWSLGDHLDTSIPYTYPGYVGTHNRRGTKTWQASIANNRFLLGYKLGNIVNNPATNNGVAFLSYNVNNGTENIISSYDFIVFNDSNRGGGNQGVWTTARGNAVNACKIISDVSGLYTFTFTFEGQQGGVTDNAYETGMARHYTNNSINIFIVPI